jgi:GNAT superfamily N-acetyltransferase
VQFEIFKAAREGLSADGIAERINAARPEATMRPATIRKHLVTVRKKGFEIPNAPRPGLSPDTLRIFELKAQGLTAAQIAQRVYPDVDPEVGKNRVYVLLSRRKDRPEVNSTGPVKYARRSGDGSLSPQENRNTQVRGRAGGPGQPDVRGRGGAGQEAAGGGDGVAGAQPARGVDGKPLPEANFLSRRWNDAVDLGPEQRAARRQQFKPFVDAVEFDVVLSRDSGDFKFKNGKRTGGRGAFEKLEYTLRPMEGAHESWAKAMDPESTRLEVEIHGNEATIPYSAVYKTLRSTGLGEKLYTKAIDDLLARGLVVNSDTSMSDGAIALWKSLRKKGYDVIQRVPDGLLERGPDNQRAARDGLTSLFFVARKKPPAPDLPMSDRDIANQIDEARNLAEHIPACIKGK